jgi:hypothetical protein
MPELVDDQLIADGNPNAPITGANFTSDGSIKKAEDQSTELSIVVQSAQAARDFLLNKQWNLLWRREYCASKTHSD